MKIIGPIVCFFGSLFGLKFLDYQSKGPKVELQSEPNDEKARRLRGGGGMMIFANFN